MLREFTIPYWKNRELHIGINRYKRTGYKLTVGFFSCFFDTECGRWGCKKGWILDLPF